MDAFKTFTKQPTRVSRIACGAGVMEMEVIIIHLNPTIMVQESFDVHLTSCTLYRFMPYWTSSRSSVVLWSRWGAWRSFSRMRSKSRTSTLKRWARSAKQQYLHKTHKSLPLYRCIRVWQKPWILKCWELSGGCRGSRAWWSRCSRGEPCLGAWACRAWSRCSRRRERSDGRRLSSIYSNHNHDFSSDQLFYKCENQYSGGNGVESQSVNLCYILYFVTLSKCIKSITSVNMGREPHELLHMWKLHLWWFFGVWISIEDRIASILQHH